MASPNPRTNPSLLSRYKPFILQKTIKYIPKGYLKVMPRFNGESGIYTKDQLTSFQDCIDHFLAEDGYIFIGCLIVPWKERPINNLGNYFSSMPL